MKIDKKRLFSLALLSVICFGMLLAPLFSMQSSQNLKSDNDLSPQPPALTDNQTPLQQYSGDMQYTPEFVSIAEKIAKYIVMQNQTIGGGLAWNVSSVVRLGYGDGAAGIGDFFLDLYEITRNIQYRDWAELVGRFLVFEESSNPDPVGKWPEFRGQVNSPHITGLHSGSAGIGKFLVRLGYHSGNATYTTLANQICTTLLSDAVATANDGMKIKDQDSTGSSGDITKPDASNPILADFIYGSLSSGNWANDLNNPSNILSLSSSAAVITESNPFWNNSAEIRIGMSLESSPNYYNGFEQQIVLDHYPFSMEGAELHINLSVAGVIDKAAIRLGIFASDSQGRATGMPIGALSDPRNASSIGGSFVLVPFVWSSGFPVLNGSSVHGYTIKTFIEANGETVDFSNCFRVGITGGNHYAKGNLFTVKTMPLNITALTGFDVIFQLSSSTTNHALNLNMNLNLTSWGMPVNFNPIYLTKVQINLTVTGASNSFLGYLQVYNFNGRYWETVPIAPFSDSLIVSSHQFNVSTVGNYINKTDANRPMKFRIIGMDPNVGFTFSLHQLNLTVAYDATAYSYGYSLGNAGIGHLFLDMFDYTHDEAHLFNAIKIGRYLAYSAVSDENQAYWVTTEGELMTYEMGSTGIADYLLRLSKYVSNDSVYLDIARKAGKRISSLLIGEGVSNVFDDAIGTGKYLLQAGVSTTGLKKGLAGVGMFLKNLGTRYYNTTMLTSFDNDYILAAQEIATFLCGAYKSGSGRGTKKVVQNVNSSFVFSTTYTGSTGYSVNYESGAAGIISFLSEVNSITGAINEELGRTISGGLQWFIDNRINHGPDMVSYNLPDAFTFASPYGIAQGLAGIGKMLISISQKSAVGYEGMGDMLRVAREQDEWLLTNEKSNYGKGSLYTGAAGFGMGFLDAYKRDGFLLHLKSAVRVAKELLYPNWGYGGGSTVCFNGIRDGMAGIGLFYLEMYKCTGNATYMEQAELAAERIMNVSEGGNGLRFPISAANGSYYNTFFEGSAGIAYYYFNLFEATGNVTYRTWAVKILDYLYTRHSNFLWHYDDSLSGAQYRYTGYLYGSAGIADVFLYGYELTKNETYLVLAEQVANRLQTLYNYHGNKLPMNEDGTGDVFTGLDYGYAGIIKFLIHYCEVKKEGVDGIMTLATNLGTALQSYKINVGNYFAYRHSSLLQDNYIGYYTGSAGIADAFMSLGLATKNNAFMIEAQKCIEYVIFKSNPATTRGANGTMSTFATIYNANDFNRPTLLSFTPTTANNIQYFQEYEIKVNVESYDLNNDVKRVIVAYQISDSDLTYVQLNLTSPERYAGVIPRVQYSKTVRYTIIIEDMAGWWTVVNNNGVPFQYTVSDLVAPVVSDLTVSGIELDRRGIPREVTGGIRYGPDGGGYIRATVKEDILGSGLKSVKIRYTILGIPEFVEQTRDMVYAGSNNYYFKFDGQYDSETVLKYGMTIQYSILAEDNAGNLNNQYIGMTAPIIDTVAPKIVEFVKIHPASRIKDGTDIQLVIKASDEAELLKDKVGLLVSHDRGGSGIKSVKFMYSNNVSLPVDQWESIEMEFDSEELVYKVDFKVKGAGKVIFYYYIVEDIAGNRMAIDMNGEQRDPNEVPVYFHYFEVTTNWGNILIIIGVVAGVIIAAYAIYVKTSSFTDRSVTSARVTAKWVGLKLWFAQKYNTFMHFLLNIGANIDRSIQHMNIRKRIKRFAAKNEDKWFVKLGRGLYATLISFLKLLLGFVVAPFYFVWAAITKSSGKQMLTIAFLGFLLIIASVVKFFSAEIYPLRALFFIDLGFILIIAAFVLIILHLLYELAAK